MLSKSKNIESCGAGNRWAFPGSEMLRLPNINTAEPSTSANTASQFDSKKADG
jgi:hypothetical protein